MLKSRDKTYFSLVNGSELRIRLIFFLNKKVHGLRGSRIKFTVKKTLPIWKMHVTNKRRRNLI